MMWSLGPDLSEKDVPNTICFRLWNDQVRSGIRSSCRSRDQDLVQQLGAFSQNFTVLEAFFGTVFWNSVLKKKRKMAVTIIYQLPVTIIEAF